MSELHEGLVIGPDEMRELESDFATAWRIVQHSVDKPLPDIDSERSRLAKIILDLKVAHDSVGNLAEKAAAVWLERRI